MVRRVECGLRELRLSSGGHTFQGEALSLVPAVVFGDEVLEVFLGILAGADLVVAVDKVALYIVSRCVLIGKSFECEGIPKFRQIGRIDWIGRETRPPASKHDHNAAEENGWQESRIKYQVSEGDVCE